MEWRELSECFVWILQQGDLFLRLLSIINVRAINVHDSHDYTSVNSTAARSCSTSPFQPTAMCAPEVSTVSIGAGARKKATGTVSLSAWSVTPPSLLNMRRMSPSAVMRNLPTFCSRELAFENANLLSSTTLLASPLCTSQHVVPLV
eukprot:06704_5